MDCDILKPYKILQAHISPQDSISIIFKRVPSDIALKTGIYSVYDLIMKLPPALCISACFDDIDSWTSYKDIYLYFERVSTNKKDLKWRRSVIGGIEHLSSS